MNDSLEPTGELLTVRLLDDSDGDVRDHWQFAPDKTVQIGRSSSSDVQLRCGMVSKLHAALSHDGNSWICTSVGRNGVYQQNQPIDQVKLTDGTVLHFAKNGPRLHFQLVSTSRDGPIDDQNQDAVEWIEGLANGDPDAANILWEEYFQRVVKLARSRIASRQRRVTDEEDVAVSVFESICAGIQAGRFPDLKDRDSLWRLLCVMTKRKVMRHATHERRQKRGGGQIRGESVFCGVGAADSNAFGLEQFGGADGGDGFGQQLVEHTEWLFEILGDDELRLITELKLAEHTNEEIATELKCNVRTVKRRLQTIRSILTAAMSSDD